MCGICGVIQVGGSPRQVVTPETLACMTDVMIHRGPNDRGTYMSDGIALGVRRLSIVDVEGGHQPFVNEDDHVWAIQNGELYNHAYLRELLRRDGHVFRSACDTEVIPHLYERFGMAFPVQLRGMFAICVWDGRCRRAVLVRDRLGIKPLYFAQCGDLLVFGSELKSVLASRLIDPDLDYEALDAYLAFGFVPGPRTLLAGVSKLMPGHRLVVDASGVRDEAYWAYPKPSLESPPPRLEECSERLLAALEESVALRLMSDVPLGAMLSGGLDSSLIVALMARKMAEPVKTFSVGFSGASESNELADARYVASVFGTDHHELELSFTPGIDLAELVWHLDEPVADLSSLGFFALSQLAANHVTVALSGQGADELLGGYSRYRAAAAVDLWGRLPEPIRRTVGAITPGSSRLRRVQELAVLDPVSRTVKTRSNLEEGARSRLVRGRLAELDGQVALCAVSSRFDSCISEPVAAMLFLDGQLALVDDLLHYFDRMSMAHSLEVRVPFLDHRVVELCATIPTRYKVRRLTTKYVLKQAARGVIPDRIIDKPKIGFFNAAVVEWFKEATRSAVSDYLLGPAPRYADFLDRAEVERLVARQAEQARPRGAHLLLSILMLEVWLSACLPRATNPVIPRPDQVRLSA